MAAAAASKSLLTNNMSSPILSMELMPSEKRIVPPFPYGNKNFEKMCRYAAANVHRAAEEWRFTVGIERMPKPAAAA
jgi:hypothetical protein